MTQVADFSSISAKCTLYAKWTARNDTKYTVVHWQENANDNKYSFADSESLQGTTGAPTAAVPKNYDGFTAKSITQETIAGDGTTIVNVYYSRNTYTVKFYNYIVGDGLWNIGDELTEYKITAKYGERISAKWPGRIWIRLDSSGNSIKNADGSFKQFSTYNEYYNYIHEAEYQARLEVMPLGGAEFWWTNMGGNNKAYYYLETLTGETYELDHEDNGADSSSIISENDCYGIPGFSFDHYIPGEWTDDEIARLTEWGLTEQEWKDKKYVDAKFYYTRNSSDVVYLNNGEYPINTKSYKYEADISSAADYQPTIPNNIPQNFIFAGWYYNKELNVPCNFSEQIMPDHNITVYAKWVPPVCKVTFVAYGQTLTNVSNVQYGNRLIESDIPTVNPQGDDVFYGWSYDEAGRQPFNYETLITENITLYAQLSSKAGYTVTYDANGGTGTVTDTHHYAMNTAAMVLSGDDLVAPEKKVFLGWNTKADGSGTMYYPSSAVPVTGNITLHAIWGDKPGTLVISKTVSGSASATKDYEFKLTVPTGTTINFKLKAGETKTFTLPAGTEYTVTETTTGYTVTAKVDGTAYDLKDNSVKGEITAGATTDVVFDNYQRRPYIPPTPDPAKKITVTITGNTGSEVYDATEHNVKGYTWECTDPSYTEADFEFTGTAEAKGTYVGKYDMGIKAEQFKNLNSKYEVEFVVKTDGELDITKRPLTITAGSAEGYGPEAITCDTYKADEPAAGDKLVSVKITGKQSVPGSSANVPSDAVIQDASGKDVTANYDIKYVNGTLTMLDILNKEDHFNYVIGYPDGTVRPSAEITRAEVATIFFRLLTDDSRKEFDTKTSAFTDVDDGQWYTRAIATLAKAKIVSGDPEGTFRPNDAITRAEMATIIARFADLSADGKTFSDISGHWAQKYIELAAGNGWINGYTDGTFRPDKKITRAETFSMINRVLGRQTDSNDDLLPVSQMTNWSDNADTSVWYYRDMQEATNNHKCERLESSGYEKWTEKLPEIDWASYQI